MSTLISIRELETKLGVKKSWIYKMIEQGRFPAQIKLGKRSLWDGDEIDAWIAKQKEER